MNARGMGYVYQPKYRDKKTKEIKTVSTWWIKYSFRGQVRRESSESMRRSDAVKLLRKRHAEMGGGKLAGPDVEKTTFEDMAAMLTNDYKANKRRSLNRVEDAVSHLKSFFGERSRGVDLTGDWITAYVAARQGEKAANATINNELSALGRMFTLAVRAGKLVNRPYIAKLATNNARKGFFEYEQFKAVIARVRENLKPVIETAFETGWRIDSEILTRHRHHVDLIGGWLRLDPGETKNGEGRMFPLTPRLRGILARQIARTEMLQKETGRIIPFLFHRNGKPIKSFRRSWMTACTDAGVPGKIRHDFRRTAVRNLERAGVPRSAAMKMVGHKTQAIYSRYAIADESMLKDAAKKLDRLHAVDLKATAQKASGGEI